MLVVAAAVPLLLVIGCVLFRQSAARAAVIGFAGAVVSAVAFFGFDLADAASVALEWWPPVVEVMLIIGGGILFADAGRRTGGQAAVAHWLRDHLGTGVAPVLAIVHGVTPVAESLSGFGIGLAIGVPLLYALGYGATRSAILGLLGLCVVPWGSLGPGTLVAARLSGVSFDDLGVAGALFNLPVFLGTGIGAVLLVAPAGRRLVAVLAAILSGLVLWGGVLGANVLLGTAPAGAVGATLALAAHLAVHRLRGGGLTTTPALRLALRPYAVLLGGVLVTAILVRSAGLANTPWHLVSSPALWLTVGAATALVARASLMRPTFGAALRSWVHVGPPTALFVFLGAVMASAGMSGTIASAFAALGTPYLLVAPFIGALGGFVGGSNSGANAMFAAPQAQAAVALGLAPLGVAAVQNISASLFIMSSPARIEFASRLCGEAPDRGRVLTGVLRVDVPVACVLAVAALLVVPRW